MQHLSVSRREAVEQELREALDKAKAAYAEATPDKREVARQRFLVALREFRKFVT